MGPGKASKSTLLEILTTRLHPLLPPDQLVSDAPPPALTYTASSATQHDVLFPLLIVCKMLHFNSHLCLGTCVSPNGLAQCLCLTLADAATSGDRGRRAHEGGKCKNTATLYCHICTQT
ncbi:Os04g0183301 [Oryza sativa Japonica Group]|uniref:Os04g0183301 protein n=1 Tax=Oryza sativa subsp. japonica TaxID=39947 RepID=A0A0P0W765_ORYSJ|nr:Os04g0183301 [Oryza sativa Japonica Group]